jgi:hypothetical protein
VELLSSKFIGVIGIGSFAVLPEDLNLDRNLVSQGSTFRRYGTRKQSYRKIGNRVKFLSKIAYNNRSPGRFFTSLLVNSRVEAFQDNIESSLKAGRR